MSPIARSRRGGGPGGEQRGGRGGASFRGKPRPTRVESAAGSEEKVRPRARAAVEGGALPRPKRDRPRPAPRERRPPAAPGEERVQKILAFAGLGSRRACEDLIRSGQVTINGQIATLGTRANPARDSIKVGGKRVWVSSQHHYLVLNKPRGFVTTVKDPEGRPTVVDLVPERLRRGLRPVGRLDFDTEGLLLLTNDGDFALHVSHPRYGCKKTYEVKVKGMPEPEALDKLRQGIRIEGRLTAPSEIKPRLGMRRRRRDDARRGPQARGRDAHRPGEGEAGRGGRGRSKPGRDDEPNASWWVVRLTEGRTRQIREMFLRIGHPVQKLRRTAIGPLRDPRLPVGAWRELTAEEVQRLRETTA